MALYAFDGTWNEDEEDEISDKETNVIKFRDVYEGPVEYRAGVGALEHGLVPWVRSSVVCLA